MPCRSHIRENGQALTGRGDAKLQVMKVKVQSIPTAPEPVALALGLGYVQRVGVLFRTLRKLQEAIVFLADAETNGARNERYEKHSEMHSASTRTGPDTSPDDGLNDG